MAKIKIQNKIFLYYILSELIFVSVMATLLFITVKPNLSNHIYEGMQQQAVTSEEYIDQFLDANVENVKTISGNPIIKSSSFSTEDKLEILNVMQGAYPIYNEISLLDTSGNVVISTSVSPKAGWENEKAYTDSLAGEFAVSSAQKRKEIVLWLLSPVYENNNIAGVVAAQMPLAALWKLTDRIKIGESGFVLILDNEGRILAHPDKSLILKNNPYDFELGAVVPNRVEFKDFKGGELIAGYSKLFETEYSIADWSVLAVQPKDEAFVVINSLSTGLTIILLIALLAASAMSFILARILAKPLTDLSKGLKRILAGEWNYKLDIRSGDEVEEISNSFTYFTRTIKEKELLERLKADLQRRVQEAEKLGKLMVGRETEIKRLNKEIKQLKEKLKRGKK